MHGEVSPHWLYRSCTCRNGSKTVGASSYAWERKKESIYQFTNTEAIKTKEDTFCKHMQDLIDT